MDPLTLASIVAIESLKAPLVDSIIKLVGSKKAHVEVECAPGTKGPSQPKGELKVERQRHVPSVAASTTVLSPAFKLVFLSILLLTVVCGAAQLVLASVWTDPTPNQQGAFEAMGFAWKAGLGSIFGLLGGKVT